MTVLGDSGPVFFCQYTDPPLGIGVYEDYGCGPPHGHRTPIRGTEWAPLGGIQLWGRWNPCRDTAPCRAISCDGAVSADGTITRELWENMDSRVLRLPAPPWSPVWQG